MSTINHELHNKAVTLSKDYKRVETDLLSVLEEIDKKKVFLELGYRSLHVYIVEALQLSDAQAYALSTVCRKAAQVPELKKAIHQGEISIQTAKRITSVITPQNQASWIEKAKTLPQRELEKAVVQENPREAVKERLKAIAADLNELRCALTDEELRLLQRVKDLCSQRKQKACSMQETLQIVLAEYIERHDPVVKAQKFSLRKKPRVTALPQRGRRPIPAAVRHGVNLRDGGQCVFRDALGRRCAQRRWVELHHVRPVGLGGLNTVGNLTTLCFFHHQAGHGVDMARGPSIPG